MSPTSKPDYRRGPSDPCPEPPEGVLLYIAFLCEMGRTNGGPEPRMPVPPAASLQPLRQQRQIMERKPGCSGEKKTFQICSTQPGLDRLYDKSDFDFFEMSKKGRSGRKAANVVRRISALQLKENSISLKEKPCYGGEHKNNLVKHNSKLHAAEEKLGEKVFERTENDNQRALASEDETFLKIMEKEVHQDENNNWVAPLPFKSPRLPLPNNRDQALSRLSSLRHNLNNKPQMKEQFSEFMDKLFKNHHAEIAPPTVDNTECWYLPIPRSPSRYSAEQCGVSLNSLLLTGPDLNNTLLLVLIWFRKELIAATAGIQQMFYRFLVSPDHRDYLRLLWHKDNDLSKEVQEYRMQVYVFGNSPSPAISIYCLRRAIQKGETKFETNTRHFIERHFYVDDGLISIPTKSAAIDLLK
ncbi:hypothetical protein CCH79_00020344 [Gambusia affinis]|uniref:Reverse transcriptase domain-containing protein n=1 Tax=Gambusia affinis TaxID=33528 RepID=A0A315VBG8_GAMAF|nr:hypothetical protein CCH79_00020344 [Gambusia affinis]